MKYSKFKYFFRSIPLFQSSLNDISEDSLIKCRRVSVARGDLTPENYAGIFLASIFFKSSFKFRMEEYRKFLNLIAICPMNILGFKWQKSSRLTACIHGYLNRINPELFYKRNLNFKGLSLVLGLIKFYLKAIISLRISCFFDILTSLKKRC